MGPYIIYNDSIAFFTNSGVSLPQIHTIANHDKRKSDKFQKGDHTKV